VGTYEPTRFNYSRRIRKVVQVNLIGTFNVTRLAIPYLKKSSAGVIIIMSSGAGRFGYANRSPYSATKWALIGFAKTLSIELGEFGIRANAILPGAIEGRGYRDSSRAANRWKKKRSLRCRSNPCNGLSIRATPQAVSRC
jgi:NAD(P)-dependent dehydrogenase (short-subunit alcohol dehydrogenase family)